MIKENRIKILNLINPKIEKLMEAGDFDRFVTGWAEVIDSSKGNMWDVDVLFSRGDSIYRASVSVLSGKAVKA